jgi:cytochrome P450
MEAVLLLVTLARAFRVEVLEKPAPKPDPSVTLRPKHGVHARLRAQSSERRSA